MDFKRQAPWEDLKPLMILAQRGDEKAYRRFLNKAAPLIRQRLDRIVPKSSIEDVTQETLIAMDRSLHTFQSERPLGPWIGAILRFKTMDYLRSHYRKERHLPIQETDLKMDDADGRRIDRDILMRSLQERERNVIRVYVEQDLSVQEASEALGLSPTNVKVIAFRAIKKLRTLLAKEIDT